MALKITKALFVLQIFLAASLFADDGTKPNIVVILADDLGYGDLRSYNEQSKVATPNLDRLAHDGIRFTDAHSASTVCTPSRYSLMTGRMCFRTGYRGGVFVGAGGPSLIEKERLTLPAMLRDQGYATGCVGKWHVGMTFQTHDGKPVHEAKVAGNNKELERVKLIDFTKSITDGPVHRGFDYFFGTACCPGTDWLYAFIENDRISVPPDRLLDVSAMPKHAYANDCRRGWVAPGFDHEMLDMVFLDKSKAWLEQQVKREPTQPFFLYHAMQAVHLPSFAAPQFKGKSNAGPHGDFIAELDFIVGELMATLQKLGVADNTLIIFSSDNGPETTSVVHMRADHQHDPARPWRGVKRDNWEGGHRVPLIVSWPGRIKPGVSEATVCLTDIMATCAAITGAKLPDNSAEDSFSFLPVLTGAPITTPQRDFTLHQTISLAMAIRCGDWKYLDHQGSGGNAYDKGELLPFARPDTAPNAPSQLYNLKTDPGETTNLYFKHPEIVKELNTLLEQSTLGDLRNRSRDANMKPTKSEEPLATTGQPTTRVSIVADKFHINGQLTYAGHMWNGQSISGLLFNSRMVQAAFDDRNPETLERWAYPDTKTWDADRNTREFLEQMPVWRKHGLLAVTINLQGGSPEGYSKSQPWHNSAVNADGSLDEAYLARVARVIDTADDLGMVVILGIYYFGQDQRVRDEAAVIAGVDATVDWLVQRRDANVLIEINNECNVKAYDHEILKPDRVHELIDRAKRRSSERNHSLLVGTSYGGGAIPQSNVVKASDFLLLHGNGVREPQRIAEMVRLTRAVEGYRLMPILFNEDDHFDFDQPKNNFRSAVGDFASWGYFDFRMKDEGFDEGFQSVPVNWSISSDRKRGFFRLLSEITGERP